MVRIRFITSEWKVPMSCTSRIFISGHEEHAETAGKELDRELDWGLWASPLCMGKIIQGRQLFRMSLRDKKETVSVNLCGHPYFAQVSLDENCTTYATFFFSKANTKGRKLHGFWMPKIHSITGCKLGITRCQWKIPHRFSKLQLHYPYFWMYFKTAFQKSQYHLEYNLY